MSQAALDEIRAFVHSAIQGLSNHPEEVKTEVVDSGDSAICIIIRCRNNGASDTDLGLIIGKQGRNIKALRTLAESIGAKHKVRPTLIVKE